MEAPPSTSNGSCALIWLGDTKSMGTGVPLTARHDSPRAVGTGISLVAILTGLSWLPQTVTSPPAATAGVKSAVLTTCVS